MIFYLILNKHPINKIYPDPFDLKPVCNRIFLITHLGKNVHLEKVRFDTLNCRFNCASQVLASVPSGFHLALPLGTIIRNFRNQKGAIVDVCSIGSLPAGCWVGCVPWPRATAPVRRCSYSVCVLITSLFPASFFSPLLLLALQNQSLPSWFPKSCPYLLNSPCFKLFSNSL